MHVLHFTKGCQLASQNGCTTSHSRGSTWKFPFPPYPMTLGINSHYISAGLTRAEWYIITSIFISLIIREVSSYLFMYYYLLSLESPFLAVSSFLKTPLILLAHSLHSDLCLNIISLTIWSKRVFIITFYLCSALSFFIVFIITKYSIFYYVFTCLFVSPSQVSWRQESYLCCTYL